MLGALIDVVLIAALAGLVWFVFAERRRFEVELGKHRTLALSVDFLRREVQTATKAVVGGLEPPAPSNATPQPDGPVGGPGVAAQWARGDHQHPARAVSESEVYECLKSILRHGEGASIIHDDSARQIVIGAPEETKE